jgi:lipopolysaccharide export system protein LptA
MNPSRPLVLCLAALALTGSLPVAGRAAEAAKAAATPPPTDTVIASDRLDMVSTEKETTFTYRGNVHVTATNLTLICDLLVVVARRSGDPKATIGKQEKLKSLVATGSVRIVQNDREATCGRAEILPDDDKIVLSENPALRGLGKESWSQTGETMVLHRGQRRAEVLGSDNNRPRATLPVLKDLGFEVLPEKKKPAGPGAAAPGADTAKDPAKAEAPAAVSVPLPPSPAPASPK